MTEQQEIIALLHEIRSQNVKMLNRVDELERTATKRGAIAGAVAGTISGAVISVGIELIKLKFGG